MSTVMYIDPAKRFLAGCSMLILLIYTRIFISETAFTELMTGMYGLMKLICAPAGWISVFIDNAKKRLLFG